MMTEEELEKIKEMEVSVINQAINAYYTITASSEFREKERLRVKARHDEAQAYGIHFVAVKDEAQALYNARREEKLGIAEKLIKCNRSTNEIVEDTGLSYEEVEEST